MKTAMKWIVVADGGRARFFQTDGALEKIAPALGEELIADRRASREINADKPGRTKDRMAHGRHAYEPPTDPHEYEEIAFAREVARRLDEARKEGAYDELAIIAPPRALGRIREALDKEVRKRIVAEVDKDLTKLKLHELREKLPALLQP